MTESHDSQVFDQYGEIYDDIYSSKPYAAEADYIHRLIQAHATRAASPCHLLELGSGTGGHARELAALGYEVTGIERSASMIAKANAQAGGPRYLQQDIRQLEVDATFDVVLSLFHVISYITDTADLLEVFKRAHRHLKPGGAFIFDFWYGPAVLSDSLGTRVLRIETPVRKICRINEPTFRVNENVVDVRFEIWSMEQTTRKTTIFTEVHPMRYLFIPELEHLLKEAGFGQVHSRRWLDEHQPPSLGDRNALIWAVS